MGLTAGDVALALALTAPLGPRPLPVLTDERETAVLTQMVFHYGLLSRFLAA
jgi:hypothetical protein